MRSAIVPIFLLAVAPLGALAAPKPGIGINYTPALSAPEPKDSNLNYLAGILCSNPACVLDDERAAAATNAALPALDVPDILDGTTRTSTSDMVVFPLLWSLWVAKHLGVHNPPVQQVHQTITQIPKLYGVETLAEMAHLFSAVEPHAIPSLISALNVPDVIHALGGDSYDAVGETGAILGSLHALEVARGIKLALEALGLLESQAVTYADAIATALGFPGYVDHVSGMDKPFNIPPVPGVEPHHLSAISAIPSVMSALPSLVPHVIPQVVAAPVSQLLASIAGLIPSGLLAKPTHMPNVPVPAPAALPTIVPGPAAQVIAQILSALPHFGHNAVHSAVSAIGNAPPHLVSTASVTRTLLTVAAPTTLTHVVTAATPLIHSSSIAALTSVVTVTKPVTPAHTSVVTVTKPVVLTKTNVATSLVTEHVLLTKTHMASSLITSHTKPVHTPAKRVEWPAPPASGASWVWEQYTSAPIEAPTHTIYDAAGSPVATTQAHVIYSNGVQVFPDPSDPAATILHEFLQTATQLTGNNLFIATPEAVEPVGYLITEFSDAPMDPEVFVFTNAEGVPVHTETAHLVIVGGNQLAYPTASEDVAQLNEYLSTRTTPSEALAEATQSVQHTFYSDASLKPIIYTGTDADGFPLEGPTAHIVAVGTQLVYPTATSDIAALVHYLSTKYEATAAAIPAPTAAASLSDVRTVTTNQGVSDRAASATLEVRTVTTFQGSVDRAGPTVASLSPRTVTTFQGSVDRAASTVTEVVYETVEARTVTTFQGSVDRAASTVTKVVSETVSAQS